MPRFTPFRALRYDPSLVTLSKVIAPPYDVISPAERQLLARRHPANAVRVELPEPEPGWGLDRYATAARLLANWQAAGLLRADPDPAFYPYRMTSPTGEATVGVLGALGLAPEGGDVLPHEETLPKPKDDRLDLLRATRANLSPIWGLSLTAGLTALLPVDGPPVAGAVDDDGVRHELWALEDPDAVTALADAVTASPVVIADGHHRYATALTYATEASPSDGPAGAVLALVVELAEHQLHVGAIHRTLSGLPDGFDLVGALGRAFELEPAGADERADGPTRSGVLVLVTPTATLALIPRPGIGEAAGGDLDAHLAALAVEQLSGAVVGFAHSRAQAVDAVGGGEAQAAILLRPVSVAQIREWAGARRRMPPKTTYFSPKPRTGMVFRSLDL